jgi:hypothetical protein
VRRTTLFGRKTQSGASADRNVDAEWCRDPHLVAVAEDYKIIAMRPEIGCPHDPADGFVRGPLASVRSAGPQFDVMQPYRYRSLARCGRLARGAAQHDRAAIDDAIADVPAAKDSCRR